MGKRGQMNSPWNCSLLMLAKNEANPARPNLETILDIYTYNHIFKEMLVLDDESTDGTADLARKYGCKVFRSEGRFPTQSAKRNFLQEKASFDWCLHSDADEFMDWSLMRNLEEWIKPDSKDRQQNVIAFKFPRFNQHHVYPDYQIRLMDRRFTIWKGKAHDRPYLKTTMRPVDELSKVGTSFCQTLDHHPIFHIPRDWAYDATLQEHWRQLEAMKDSEG